MRSNTKIWKLILFFSFIGILLNFFQFFSMQNLISKNVADIKTIEMEIRKSIWLKSKIEKSISSKTIQTNLFAVGAGGGLGNLLFEIISLRGIADLLNRRAVINVVESNIIANLFRKIYPIFPRLLDEFDLQFVADEELSKFRFNYGSCCRFSDPLIFANSSESNLFLEGHYFQSFKYFWNLKSEVKKWLTPNRLVFLRAEMMLPEVYRNDFRICTHIRRGDFTSDGLHQPSDEKFTRSATEFLVRQYQEIYEKVTVVVLGNDFFWAFKVFGDKVGVNNLNRNFSINGDQIPRDSPEYITILTPTLQPEIDLAFSKSFCDVFLITAPSSTFAWWLAFVSKADEKSVYYRDIIESKDGVANEMREDDFFPPQWIKLSTGSDGKIQKSL